MTEYQGKVRLVFKDLPLASHEGAVPAAEAARCAGEQGRFWEYHDLLFVSQPSFSRADLATYAARLGLAAEPFAQCLDSGRQRGLVRADAEQGRAAGVRGTPTFFINGRRLVGAQPFEVFQAAIQQALNDTGGKRP
jgi:protein-disulfide isomerase